MIKHTFLVVGKLKEKYLKEAFTEYQKRISRYANVEIIEIPDENDNNNMAVDIESNKIISKIPKKSYNILLDLKGEMITSEILSEKIDKISLQYSNICYIIGGSNGVNNKVRKIVDYRLCFSKFTFPHQLIRIMLIEQIYRSICINKNIKYHK